MNTARSTFYTLSRLTKHPDETFFILCTSVIVCTLQSGSS